MAQMIMEEESANNQKAAKGGVAKARKRKGVDKWKNKKWFSILAPAAFNNSILAQTPGEAPEGIMGRVVLISARELTGNIKKTQLMLRFRVNNVQGLNAYTQLDGVEFQAGSVRRLVRRRSTKVEAVDDVSSKDGKPIRIKSVALSTIHLSRPQQTAIRKLLHDDVKVLAAENDYEALLTQLVTGEYGGNVIPLIRKIAPMKRVDILKVSML